MDVQLLWASGVSKCGHDCPWTSAAYNLWDKFLEVESLARGLCVFSLCSWCQVALQRGNTSGHSAAWLLRPCLESAPRRLGWVDLRVVSPLVLFPCAGSEGQCPLVSVNTGKASPCGRCVQLALDPCVPQLDGIVVSGVDPTLPCSESCPYQLPTYL